MPKPIRVSGRKVGRNDRCPCGSGDKWKRCCGRTPNRRPLNYVDIRSFYVDLQKQKEEQFIRRWGLRPDPTQLRTFMYGSEDDQVAMIVRLMVERGADPKFIEGVKIAKRLATGLNKDAWTDEEQAAYFDAMVQTGAYVEVEDDSAGAAAGSTEASDAAAT